MRDDELFAQRQFDSYLRKKSAYNICWQEGNQNAPPDFYLTIADEKFVVEVTALTEQVELSGKLMSIMTVHNWCKDFVAEIEDEAKRKGKLKGTYYIGFSDVDMDVHSVRRPLKAKLLEFITITQEESRIDLTSIEVDNIDYCSILKTSIAANKVMVSIYPSTTKWESEALEEAGHLVKVAITRKAKALSQFSQKKILLLISVYPFVSTFDYDNLLAIQDLSQFHTVFIADAYITDRNHVIYSQNLAWD